MLLSKYISGTIFIDDNPDDVQNLIKYFEKYNIWSKNINPDDFDGNANYNYAGARVVFLDLQYNLSGGPEIVRATNILRDLSQNGVKNFILVVWSMHSSEIHELIENINDKMACDKPLIILDAKKEDCINISFEEFSQKMDELFEESIRDNPVIYSLLEWEKNTQFSSRDTFNDIVALAYDLESNEFDFEKVLAQMAEASENNTNIKSAFPYMHDILSDNIIKYSEKMENYTLTKRDSEELILKLNTLQMIKKDELTNYRPGDVYKFCLEDSEKIKIVNEIIEGLGEIVSPDKIIPIQLDITPPCTFLKTNKSIMISGCIIEDYNNDMKKKLKVHKQNYSINYYYEFEGNKKNILILDFIKTSTIIRNDNTLEKLFCLKTEFRSSIQQQFGCFLTRIGDNIIHIK